MSLKKILIEISNSINFEDVDFDQLDRRFYVNKYSPIVNEEHTKKFKAKDGNYYIIRKDVNRDIFNVYTLDYKKVAFIVVDVNSDYISGYTSNDSIYVEPTYRRKGLASVMVKFVENYYGKIYKPTDTAREDFKKVLNKL